MSKALIKRLLRTRKEAVEFEESGVVEITDCDGDIKVNYELFFKLAKDSEIRIISGYLCIDTDHDEIQIVTEIECNLTEFLEGEEIKFKMV